VAAASLSRGACHGRHVATGAAAPVLLSVGVQQTQSHGKTRSRALVPAGRGARPGAARPARRRPPRGTSPGPTQARPRKTRRPRAPPRPGRPRRPAPRPRRTAAARPRPRCRAAAAAATPRAAAPARPRRPCGAARRAVGGTSCFDLALDGRRHGFLCLLDKSFQGVRRSTRTPRAVVTTAPVRNSAQPVEASGAGASALTHTKVTGVSGRNAPEEAAPHERGGVRRGAPRGEGRAGVRSLPASAHAGAARCGGPGRGARPRR